MDCKLFFLTSTTKNFNENLQTVIQVINIYIYIIFYKLNLKINFYNPLIQPVC